MKHPFNKLTYNDVEILRRKKGAGATYYNFTADDVAAARKHLQTLYPNCRVQTRFATTILLLNELY